jgi:RND family efflux transporter MFP subunit
MRTPSCPIRPRQGRAAGRAASAGKQQSIQRRMAATREADKLIEEATVDCYNEEEQASGLFTAIDENLALPFATQVLGVEVAVVAVEMDDDSSLKAVCERGGNRQRIDLTDLPDLLQLTVDLRTNAHRERDVLAKIDPRLYQAALDQAKAKKAQDEAQLISAKKDLQRSRTLVDKFVETMQLVDQQQAKVDQGIALVDADRAAIETAQTNLDYTSIVAPSDGHMGVRMIDPGNVVHASDSAPIGMLTLTKPAAVIFTLSARFLDDVRNAMMRGPVEVTAFSQDNRRIMGKGTLLLIDNTVDQASATMRLKAMFANEDDQLWPGDFVNARVSLDVLRDALTVPSAAIQAGPDGKFAWVVAKDDVVQARAIVVGPTTDARTNITWGLDEGDRVVVAGQ